MNTLACMDDVAIAAEHESMQLERLLTDLTCPIHACIGQVLTAEQHEPNDSRDPNK